MKNQGLTLIELVIVLAVFSILSAVISLSFVNIDRNELQSVSLKLQADLRYAQRMAMIEGRIWKITFTPGSYVISAQQQGVTFKIVDNIRLENGVVIRKHNVEPTGVLYLPRGTISKGFTINLKNGKYSQTLTATPSSGRIAVSEISSFNGG